MAEQVLPVADSAGVPLLPRLLHDHLLHHRMWRTAAVIQQDLMQVRFMHGPHAQCPGRIQRLQELGILSVNSFVAL